MIRISEHLKNKPTPDMQDWERILVQGLDFVDAFNEWLVENEHEREDTFSREEKHDHEMELYKLLVEYKGRLRAKELYGLVNKELPSKTLNSGFYGSNGVVDRNIKRANSMIEDLVKSVGISGSTEKTKQLLNLLDDLRSNPTEYLSDKIRYEANRKKIDGFLQTHNYTKKAKDALTAILNTF